jgi:hypothetical protein
MRVYHFINREYGLEDLKLRHLKVATINDLNDPFDIFPIDASDSIIRYAFQNFRQILADNLGLLCFSRDWHNPVQWSHYAEKHQGFCLGFDIPDERLDKVIYSRKLLVVNTEGILADNEHSIETAKKLLLTKYSHWRYESEVRAFINLRALVSEKGMYFIKFSDNLRLAQVIIGSASTLSRLELIDALGDLAPSIEVFKTRLAFKSFRVVKQRKQELWA